MKLSEIARMLDGQLIGKDATFHGASFDSRKIHANQLFVAFKGEHVDGHAFLNDAMKRGAAGALVAHHVESELPQIIVNDVRLALGEVASYYREQLSMPIIGLTGSCGKTTTKTLIANVLAEAGHVHATEGTLNNDYGMPLTLLNAKPTDNFVVLEMGANHLHEIAYLTYIARPTIALITNAGPVHLEGFGSVEGVARGKGEIFQGLKQNGVAIINIDDAFAEYWQQLVSGTPFITFGLSKHADVYATDIKPHNDGTIEFMLHTLSGSAPVHMALIGEHNVMNALAAAAVGIAAGVSLEKICLGLAGAKAVDKRLVPRTGLNGAHIIDDTYNANPIAMEMAIKVLMQFNGEKVFVTGDMAELGPDAATYHHELGEKARQLGVNRLYTVGKLSQHTAEGFGQNAHHFTDQNALINALQAELKPAVHILIKGSRSARMENVVKALLPKDTVSV